MDSSNCSSSNSNSSNRAGREQVTTNENANSKRRPINWTSIVTVETGCEHLSEIRVKSESCKLKMNLGESSNGTTSTAGAPTANTNNHDTNGTFGASEPSSPLDFSLKKRKLDDHEQRKIVGVKNGGSAFETVMSNPSPSLLGVPKSTVGFGHLLTGQSPATNSSPFLLNPSSMFPLSLAAAASVHHQNFGAAVASVSNNHHHPQQQHNLLSSTTVDVCGNRKPIAALNGANGSSSSLLAQHLASQPQQSSAAVRNQRPFKAYDPMKPGSALNVNPFLPPTNLASASPLLNTGVPPQQLFSDQLLAQYCQYILSAQTLASLNKPKPNALLDESLRASFVSVKTNGNSTANGDGFTVSPPQVTSTSHPHIDSSTPPASGLDSSSSSVSIGNGAESSCNGDNDKPESNETHDSRSPLMVENCAVRRRGKSLPDELKDEAYWERRRKNNEAAKRSRDLRRAKEDEIAIRAALLEQENSRLRIEVAALKAETEKLRQMLLNS